MSAEDTATMDPVGKPPEPATADAGLVLLYAPDYERIPAAFALEHATVLIGRDPGAGSLRVPQQAISRVHAKIERRSDGFWVRDLGSRNGVFVDGERLEQARLHHGTQLRLGDALFKFVERDARAHAYYGLDGTARGVPPVGIAGAVGRLCMARLSAELDTVAKADLSVFILGQTGTGKELVARSLHIKSEREGPFFAINCAAVPPTLIESELFGYKRGAFTGAQRDHVGLIRSANGGTLMLDEVGDMPPEVQAKLLRVLETREVLPIGAIRGEPVDVRIVSATHRDLRLLVSQGQFRADLFARLSGHTVMLPPLRDRKEDAYALVRHFLALAGTPDVAVSFGFMLAICSYDWPFNIRELALATKRALAFSGGAPLQERHLPTEVQAALERGDASPSERATLRTTLVGDGVMEEAARPPKPSASEMEALLATHRGNVAAVGRVLGRNRSLVHRWMVEYGIDPDLYR